MNNKNLIAAIAINIFITVFEIAFGLFAGSLALISDALHNFTDVGSMGLSLWGEKVKLQKPTPLKTYGYKRAEIVIALFNALALLAVVVFIFAEAVKRLFSPAEIATGTMFTVALIALIGNGIATYLLQKGANKNLNLKSAWLHSLQDALFSLGVVAGAVIIHYTHWSIIDPLISIFLSAYLLKEVYGLIKQTVSILMESVPDDIDYAEVKNRLAGFDGVKSVEDLHIWQTDSNSRFLSAHLVVENINSGKRHDLLCTIKEALDKNFRISHMTIQMVSFDEKLKLDCNHCN
jgi:cobalt-zinc-cadmium efflux system protein